MDEKSQAEQLDHKKNEIKSSNLSKYIFQRKIGLGSFGKVYQVKSKENNKIYAAKITINALGESSLDLFQIISCEVSIISKLNHPSILKFIEYSPINFKQKPKPTIIMEYAPNGSLKQLIDHDIANPHNHILTGTQKLKIIYGIASAMSYLHSHNILHLDLKPANILLDNFYLPKIGDFGLSKDELQSNFLIKTESCTIKGTPIFIAPEIWLDGKYSKASDVYAFSIIVFELMTCTQAFPGKNIFNLMIDVPEGVRPSFDVFVPEAYKWLIIRCWFQDASQRPTFDEIVSELSENDEYITKDVNNAEFIEYVEFIKKYKTSFDPSKAVIPMNYYKKFSSDSDRMIRELNNNFWKSIYIPYKYMKSLNDESIRHVKEAELGDPSRQLYVSLCMIEGRYDFPFNVQIGLLFLKESMKGGNKEAVFYYINMLIKGKVIPQNHVKARKLIDKFFCKDESARLYLHGKVLKKEKKYIESANYFKLSYELNNMDSMCEYAELVLKGRIQIDKTENAINLYKNAINHGHLGAMYKLGIHLYNNSEKIFQEEGVILIKKAADGGNLKAMHAYGTIVEKENDDRDAESMKYFKRAADGGQGKSMNKYGIKLLKYHSLLPKKEDKSEVVRYMKKASHLGFTDSMLEYGKMLVYGDIGVPLNVKEGAMLIRNAAMEGNPDAIGQYGILLKYGNGVKIDTEEAIKYFKLGIEKGSTTAMVGYAYMLKKGQGVDIDYKEAIKYFKMAIDKGDDDAIYDYGLLFHFGQGVDVDYQKAIKYYKMAIDKGNDYAMCNYAYMLNYGQGVDVDYKEAIKYYKMAIDKGNDCAMCNYGLILQNGRGVDVDYKEAIKYYKMAIDKGNSCAMCNYAYMLKNGQGVTPNCKEAIKYYKMSIDKGFDFSMVFYADMLRKGEGSPIDFEGCIKYYKMAIDKGNPEAMYDYGTMLENGEGVEADIEKANKYYRMAIDSFKNESFKSQTCLMSIHASILFHGKGVEKDEEQAIKIYKEAISFKEEEAMLQYGKILIDRNESKEKIEEGIDLIRKAAKIGIGEALYEYGHILEEGKIIDRNVEESMKYYKMASERGHRKAKESLQHIIEQA